MSNQKESLRRVMQRCLVELTAEEKEAENEFVCRELLQYIPQGSVVCGYYPLKTEVDVRPLLQALLRRGDHVFLPSVEADSMVFRRMENEKSLRRGVLGNLEPAAGAAILQQEPDILLVPGLVFDQEGHRLGRGKGMYDRWMRQEPGRSTRTLSIGIAFNCQLVEKVPREGHDQPVDTVVTAQKLGAEPLGKLFGKLRKEVP